MERTKVEGVQCACRKLQRFVRPSTVLAPTLVVRPCPECKHPVTKIWYPAENPQGGAP